MEAEKDLISRQAVIDAICTEGTRLERNGTTAMVEIKQWCVDILEQLPSAQPEIIRCKDCKYNPKITWFGCPLAHCSETQRPETAWCWKAERREE